MSSGIAFIVDYEEDITLGLDVTDPSNITEVGQFDWIPCALETVADVGYICTLGEGVLVYNFSHPSAPVFLDEHYGGGDVGDLVISGNYAFVAAVEDGLEILDITDPENLVEVAQINDGGIARNVFVQENIAYVSEIEDGLEIIQLWGEDEISRSSSFSHVAVLLGLITAFVLGKRKKRTIE